MVVFAVLLLAWSIATVVLAMLLAATVYLPLRVRGSARAALCLLIPIYFVLETKSTLAPLPMTICALLLAVLLASPLVWTGHHRLSQRTARAVAAGFGVLTILFLLDVASAAHTYNSIGEAPPQPAVHRSAIPTHRVLWIIFDELSYKQLFEDRAANGLRLPTFDALRAQSVTFTHALPPAEHTELSIPSLFTGRAIDGVTAAGDSARFHFKDSAAGRGKPIAPLDTVFGDTAHLGLNSSIVGWYNPYCSILPGVLDSCYWQSRIYCNLGVPGESSIPRATFTFLASWFDISALHHQVARGHILDYQELLHNALIAERDTTQALTFIHVPVPHYPAIWNRKTLRFDEVAGSYLDNLDLSDRTLAQITAAMPADTVLIVSSDHSWRTFIWRRNRRDRMPAEDVAADRGGYDPRIPFLVHFPKQQTKIELDQPFEAVRTRDLIGNILAGKITSAADVQSWALLTSGASGLHS